jgi:uncharacterized protein (DUF1697 family)
MAEHGWVALLRGINVGSRNAVPMAGLRRLFEENGCGSVTTYIRSGNVVFTSAASDRAALAGRLERAVASTFGVSALVVLRTFAETRRVARSHPFGPDTSQSLVVFLAQKPRPKDVGSLKRADVAPDRFKVVGSDVFLHYPNGVRGAQLTGALLERRLGVAGTMRNWRTVTRLAELADAPAD